MPSRDPSHLQPSTHLLLRAAWNTRLLGLFIVGPVAGSLLGALTFAMPVTLRWAGLGMFAVVLALLGLLVRIEYRRLAEASAAQRLVRHGEG